MATRRGRFVARGAVGLALALVLVACGSDSKTSTSSGSSAETARSTKALKTPAYKIGLAVPSGTQTVNEPSSLASAQIAVDEVNAAGGIQGHKVELVTCNTKNDANETAACAQDLVDAHVIGSGPNYSLTGGAQTIMDILRPANIVSIGITPSNLSEYSDASAFLIDPGRVGLYSTWPQLCKDAGGKSMFIAHGDAPQVKPLIDELQAAARQVGVSLKGQATSATEATDFSPAAQQAKDSGADCVALAYDPRSAGLFIQAAESLGLKARYQYLPDTLSPDQVTQIGPEAAGRIHMASGIPALGDEANVPELHKLYRALDAKSDAGDANADAKVRNVRTVLSYLAIKAIAMVAQDLPTVDAKSVFDALNNAKDLDIGVIAPWTPGKKGPKCFPRLSTTSVYYMTYKNGKTSPIDDKQHPLNPAPIC
jgi:ABC-type branched-subunit amino acid transport system substrate-binding protein